jgi:hypothetical protein
MSGHAGFDTYGYPGDMVLMWLKDTNFEWCG